MVPSMLEEEEDDENSNQDEDNLTLTKRQKVNPYVEHIHSHTDFCSGNEIIEPKTTTTPSEHLSKLKNPSHIPSSPLNKPTPHTFTMYSSSGSNTNTSDDMFKETLAKNLAAIRYRSNP